MRSRGIRHFLMPAIGCLALILTGPSVARAHGPNGTLSDQAYQEMRRLARQLDGQAQRANDQSQGERYPLYRDRTLTRAISNFARRAGQFNNRMGTYRTQPWQVDDELRILLRSARDVQSRIRRSRYTDERTLADWDQVVNVLSRMTDVYQSDTSGGGRYGTRQPYSEPGYRPEPYVRPGESGYSRQPGPGGYGYSGERLVSLARELDARATRAHELAERLATGGGPREQQFFEAIHHFNDQARAFREGIESGDLAERARVRAEADHLLNDARDADNRMRQNNVFPEVWQEWQGTMQVLQRILNLVGA